MPKFFFDVCDGSAEFNDTAGINLERADIPAEASNLLRLLSHERLPYGMPCMLVAVVRNEAGDIVYHVTADLRCCPRDRPAW